MSLSSQALSLISCIYEAGREPRAWRVAVDQIVACVDAMGGGLQLHDAKSLQPTFCEQVGLSRESISDYVRDFMRDNPVVKASLSTPVGVPILDWMAVPKRDLMQTPIYQEWGRRNGVHAMANVVLLREATQFANFNLIRSPALGDFEQHDLKWLDLMAPHLRRAVEMNRLLAKLDRDRYAAYAALEHLKTAVLLLGADGYVVHMNAAAVAMVNAKDGLELSHNRLHAAKPDADRALARMMHVAAFHLGGQGGTAILPRPSGRRALVARIYPLVTRGCFVPPQGARVIVFLTDPEVPLPSIDHVARAYGLTKAEARLVARLIDSPTLLHAADALAITEATARTLLGRAFAKTGTSRQAELVRLVFATTPPVKPD